MRQRFFGSTRSRGKGAQALGRQCNGISGCQGARDGRPLHTRLVRSCPWIPILSFAGRWVQPSPRTAWMPWCRQRANRYIRTADADHITPDGTGNGSSGLSVFISIHLPDRCYHRCTLASHCSSFHLLRLWPPRIHFEFRSVDLRCRKYSIWFAR